VPEQKNKKRVSGGKWPAAVSAMSLTNEARYCMQGRTEKPLIHGEIFPKEGLINERVVAVAKSNFKIKI